jgi:lipopolysaccharide biosynthesis glycosyltransferase
MKKTLNVFFAVSKVYVQYFTVAATSLLENNKNLDISIYIIIDKLELSSFDAARIFFKDKYNTALNIINTGDIDFSRFKTTEDYPKYTYFRLFLASLAPANIDVALFLDSDIIINDSIYELANIDMTNKYICAVREVSVDDNVKRLNGIGIPTRSYFNAGVILVNIKAWRDDKLDEKFITIAKEYADKLEWVDQDILNIYFANNWYQLDKKYNGIHITQKLAAEPVIIHYNTYSKPWHYVDTHPYNFLYQKYLSITPYKGSKLTNFSFKNFMLKKGRLFKRKLRE